MMKTLKVGVILVLVLQLGCVGLAALVTAVPLRLELRLLHLGQPSLAACTQAGPTPDCLLERAVLDAGCDLLVTDNQDTGKWAIYWTPYEELGNGRGGTTTDGEAEFGVGDCGTLLHHTFVAFAYALGRLYGGPAVPGAYFYLAVEVAGAEPGLMHAEFVQGCTDFVLEWFDYVDGYPLHYGVDDYGKALSSGVC